MNNTPKRVSAKTLVIAFAAMIILLCVMVFAALHHGEEVRFGATKGAHAFGTAMLMQASSSQYDAALYSDEEALLRALDNRLLDAALISVESALQLPEDAYSIRGVFSVTELLVLSDEETVLSMQSLSGRKLILPETLRGSKEENMLKKLLDAADTAGTELIYTHSVATAWQNTPGSVILIPMEQLNAVLSSAPAFSVRFRLSAQWRIELLGTPPAAYCIVCRNEVIGTGTYSAFEKQVRDSMTYSDRKRKKTIAMAVATGLLDSEAEADQLIDHCSFSYLEGAEMEDSIKAWKAL